MTNKMITLSEFQHSVHIILGQLNLSLDKEFLSLRAHNKSWVNIGLELRFRKAGRGSAAAAWFSYSTLQWGAIVNNGP